MRQISELRPDRIALYAYAHLPERFKPQRRIAEADLPSAAQRISMLGDAISGFLSRDYCYIGMDHFALPDDSLAVAKREGRLHRNFQGYSTQPDCDLVALGVSAIGRVGAAYYQNAKTLPEYYEALQQRRLPVVRGYALTGDDVIRRDVIMALMCQGRLEFAPIERDARHQHERLLRALSWRHCAVLPSPGWSHSQNAPLTSRWQAGSSSAPSRWCSTAIFGRAGNSAGSPGSSEPGPGRFRCSQLGGERRSRTLIAEISRAVARR